MSLAKLCQLEILWRPGKETGIYGASTFLKREETKYESAVLLRLPSMAI